MFESCGCPSRLTVESTPSFVASMRSMGSMRIEATGWTRGARGKRLAPVRALIASALAVTVFASGAAGASAKPALKVGHATLHRCGGGLSGYCGSIGRALDPAKPRGARIKIGFRWLPASGHDAKEPAIVAVEG